MFFLKLLHFSPSFTDEAKQNERGEKWKEGRETTQRMQIPSEKF